MSSILAQPSPLMQALDLMVESRLGGLTGRLDPLWDPATCPTALLPWVAASLGALVWPKQSAIADRRAWVAEASLLAARAGTAWAVPRALELCGLPLVAVERTGTKSYRVVLSEEPTGAQLALLTALCAAYAPLTSRLDAIDVEAWALLDGNSDDGLLDGNVASSWIADGGATGAVVLPPDGGGLGDLSIVETPT